MTLSNNMNDTTKNLIEAFDNFKSQSRKILVYKLTYDIDTGIVNGCTIDDTDQPYVEVTQEQIDKGIGYKKLRYINGKLEEIPRVRLKKLPLVQGNKWHTCNSNMLIIGNERGWDERQDY
jgi:hypothetical protein